MRRKRLGESSGTQGIAVVDEGVVLGVWSMLTLRYWKELVSDTPYKSM